MKHISKLSKLAWITALAGVVMATGPLNGAWELITDFSTETREDFYAWKRFPPKGTFYFDGLNIDDPSNRGLYIDGEEPDENRGNNVFVGLTLPDGGVAPAGKASLKWDFYAYGAAMQFLVGLSDVPVTVDDALSLDFGRMLTPIAWGDYETVSRARTTWDVRDGNQYLISETGVAVGEWMTVYQYIDNETDTFEMYVKTQADAEPVQLVINNQSVYTFRNGTEEALVTLILAATQGTGNAWPDAWVVDNIYIDLDGRNPELPDAVTPVKTHALGYTLQDGYINTENWLGWLYGMEDPYFQHLDLDWCYINADGFDASAGSWVFFFYGDAAYEDWDVLPDGNVDTGGFMKWLYLSETDYAFSYSLERWIYLPEPPTGSTGAWAFIGPPPPEPVDADYPIVALTNAPFIDGISGDGEWSDAANFPLTYEALVASGKGYSKQDENAGSPQPDAVRAEGQSYVAATAEGMYFAFDITDGDIYTNPGFGVAGNGFDGVQIGIDVNPDPSDRTSTVLLDINPPVSPSDWTNVYARWAIEGYMPAWGVQASTTVHDSGYFVELMVPWSFVTSFGVDNPFTTGSNFRLTFAVMDFDETGTQRDLLWDSGEGSLTIGDGATYPIAAIVEELEQVKPNYSIPKVATAPAVDGTIGEEEWLHAKYIEASYENWAERAGGVSKLDVDTSMANPDVERAEGDIYVLATDDALYFAARIVDSSIYITKEFGTATNGNDGVQLCLDLNPAGENRDTAILWDFTAATLVGGELTGPANIFARWGADGHDPAWGIEAVGTFTDDGYIIEVKMPWQVMKDLGFDNPLDAGSIFKLGFIVVDFNADGTVVDLLSDFGMGSFTAGTVSSWNDAVLDD